MNGEHCWQSFVQQVASRRRRVPPVSEQRIVLQDLVFGESPRWHDGRLWLCDWGAQEIIAVELDGARELVAEVPAFPFSIDWLPDGRLVVVAQGGLFLEDDGVMVAWRDLSGLSDRPWNEIVVDGRGNTFVNGIGFDLMAGEKPAPGLIAVVTSDGLVRQVAGGLAFPNGMVVTPDSATLVVAESYAGRLSAFDIEPDGSLVNRRVWADLGDAAPDGLCLDEQGAIWYADVPHRRCVRVREGGEVLQTVELDRGCFACTLGGADRRTLLMLTARWVGTVGADADRTGQVVAINAPAAGAGHP
jgi:sugar lactone lactonase YvrE